MSGRPEDLTSLTRVETADVYKDGWLAATLARGAGGVEFRYSPDYLAAQGRAVATTLPLGDHPVLTAAGAVPPFFAGLLPEGHRLTALRRAVKTSSDDELSLLLAIGRDTIGDVQVVPTGLPPDPPEPLVSATKDWSEIRFEDLLADAGLVDSVGLPGVQEKVSARMIAVPVSRAGERSILKIDPPEFPHLVVNEAFFLRLARKARMETARAEVVTDRDGRLGLLVRRFDRTARPEGTTASLACEDGCQVLGRWPADKYRLTSEEVVTGLAERCAARPVAVQALFRQFCFGWLTGNGNLHGKNVAILATPSGEWRVSPAYDLPSSVPYGDTSTALTLHGRDRGITRRHLLGFAAEVGLPSAAAAKVLDQVLATLADLERELLTGALPFAQKTTADLVAELRFRRRQATA